MAAIKSCREDAVNIPQTSSIMLSNCAEYTGSPAPLQRLTTGVSSA
jgi:hypothetical protein